ncbi:hypothetical protein AAG906_036970 [Vitis piasezkii]
MLELQCQPVVEGVMTMTKVKICENVSGQRSKYVKDLGFSLKSTFAFRSRPSSSQHEVELEHMLSKTQLLMEA